MDVAKIFNRPLKPSRDLYKDILKKELMEYFKTNPLNIPKLEKVVVSITPGLQMTDKKVAELITKNLALIAGQKPVVCYAKKAVSSFKIRTGMPVGAKVTLRKKMMYNFIDKLVHISMPRIKDFKGLSARALDAQFNYNVGIKDYSIFREVDFSASSAVYGLNITFFIRNSGSKDQSLYLLRSLGLPILP